MVVIDPEGNISGLVDDVLDKLNLGKRTIERVSEVEFNSNLQQWEARLPSGFVIARGAVRSEVIEEERKYFTKKTLENLNIAV